jgi:hypothetical protein
LQNFLFLGTYQNIQNNSDTADLRFGVHDLNLNTATFARDERAARKRFSGRAIRRRPSRAMRNDQNCNPPP